MTSWLAFLSLTATSWTVETPADHSSELLQRLGTLVSVACKVPEFTPKTGS